MAIVVSDTSAIRALHHLNLLTLIAPIYGQLFLPSEVDNELRFPLRNFPSIDLASAGLALVRTPSAPYLAKISPRRLDPGETEAIALALELQSDYLLIDEQAGRDVARQLAIRHVGVLGVLIESKNRRYIKGVAPLLARLRLELRFHIRPDLERSTLAKIGEIPQP